MHPRLRFGPDGAYAVWNGSLWLVFCPFETCQGVHEDDVDGPGWVEAIVLHPDSDEGQQVLRARARAAQVVDKVIHGLLREGT